MGRLRSIDVGSEESAMQFSCSVHLCSIQKNRRSSLVLVLFSPLPQLGIQIFWTVRQAVMAGVCFCPGIGLSGCALRNDTEIEERAFLALQLAKVPVSSSQADIFEIFCRCRDTQISSRREQFTAIHGFFRW